MLYVNKNVNFIKLKQKKKDPHTLSFNGPWLLLVVGSALTSSICRSNTVLLELEFSSSHIVVRFILVVLNSNLFLLLLIRMNQNACEISELRVNL